jgi:DNA-binding PadR family transcriptional regulator
MRSHDVILGMLMGSPSSGYEIKQKFEKIFSYFYNASYGTIYPTLKSMEQEGFITKESLIQDGKPNKNVYTITDKGKEEFYRYLSSDLQDVEFKSDFMVRMYFGEFAEPEKVEQWLRIAIEDTEKSLAKLTGDYSKWCGKMSPTQSICIKIGISNSENILRNLRQGLREIQALSVTESN